MPLYRKLATRLHPLLISLFCGKRVTESSNVSQWLCSSKTVTIRLPKHAVLRVSGYLFVNTHTLFCWFSKVVGIPLRPIGPEPA
jgi:hypothetical protein